MLKVLKTLLHLSDISVKKMVCCPSIVFLRKNILVIECLFVWRDRVRRLATDTIVMRSSPATGHIRCALLVNQPRLVESTFVTLLAYLSNK